LAFSGGIDERGVKETKAQRVERLKGELNPWRPMPISSGSRARAGMPSARVVRHVLPLVGIYTQGDGVGAIGGKGGEARRSGI